MLRPCKNTLKRRSMSFWKTSALAEWLVQHVSRRSCNTERQRDRPTHRPAETAIATAAALFDQTVSVRACVLAGRRWKGEQFVSLHPAGSSRPGPREQCYECRGASVARHGVWKGKAGRRTSEFVPRAGLDREDRTSERQRRGTDEVRPHRVVALWS